MFSLQDPLSPMGEQAERFYGLEPEPCEPPGVFARWLMRLTNGAKDWHAVAPARRTLDAPGRPAS